MKPRALQLRISGVLTKNVRDLDEAQSVYVHARDLSGEGYQEFPEGKVGRFRISYNGRVWDGDTLVLERRSMTCR